MNRGEIILYIKDVFNYIDDEYHLNKMLIHGMPVNRDPMEEVEIYIFIEFDKNKSKWDNFCKDLIKSINTVESIIEEIKFSQFIIHYNALCGGENCKYSNTKDGILNLIESEKLTKIKDLEFNIVFRTINDWTSE